MSPPVRPKAAGRDAVRSAPGVPTTHEPELVDLAGRQRREIVAAEGHDAAGAGLANLHGAGSGGIAGGGQQGLELEVAGQLVALELGAGSDRRGERAAAQQDERQSCGPAPTPPGGGRGRRRGGGRRRRGELRRAPLPRPARRRSTCAPRGPAAGPTAARPGGGNRHPGAARGGSRGRRDRWRGAPRARSGPQVHCGRARSRQLRVRGRPQLGDTPRSSSSAPSASNAW